MSYTLIKEFMNPSINNFAIKGYSDQILKSI